MVLNNVFKYGIRKNKLNADKNFDKKRFEFKTVRNTGKMFFKL